MNNSFKGFQGLRRHRGFKNRNIFNVLLFPLAGIASVIWVLARIIPKPSRAGYPCMRVAMPVASSFLLYLLGSTASAFAFRWAKRVYQRSHYTIAAVFVLLGILAAAIVIVGTHVPVRAFYPTAYHVANNPIGEAIGIFPGRVVWVHDPDATNESCIPNQYGHGWFLSENNDQSAVDRMLSTALRAVSGEPDDGLSWDAIFKYHNGLREKGNVPYQTGEKVFIKINATSSWSGNFNTVDLSIVENSNYGISETSPHLVLSLLRQLVYEAGVAQSDLYVGDPMKHIYKHNYELWSAEFPGVHYLDHDGYAGRERVVVSQTAKIFYSDRGTVLRTGSWEDPTVGDPVTEDRLYTIFEEAEYLINVPTLKGHARAGVTMFAKNHFGSHTRSDAKHLHLGLVDPDGEDGSMSLRDGYGRYRIQVDLIGHELLGRKNLLYLMDALWTSDFEVDEPDKWIMAPFNNDWTSSIFLSLDPLAIESVGFDFLRAEFTVARGLAAYPQMSGVDDYLHQAADPSSWPEGFVYDPEDDGVSLICLGVHEHWNNSVDKQYARNLGSGSGIELFKVDPITRVDAYAETGLTVDSPELFQNYPNPFNIKTIVRYTLPEASDVAIVFSNIRGEEIDRLFIDHQSGGHFQIIWNAPNVPSGIYFYRLQAGNFVQTKKMVLIK